MKSSNVAKTTLTRQRSLTSVESGKTMTTVLLTSDPDSCGPWTDLRLDTMVTCKSQIKCRVTTADSKHDLGQKVSRTVATSGEKRSDGGIIAVRRSCLFFKSLFVRVLKSAKG